MGLQRSLLYNTQHQFPVLPRRASPENATVIPRLGIWCNGILCPCPNVVSALMLSAVTYSLVSSEFMLLKLTRYYVSKEGKVANTCHHSLVFCLFACCLAFSRGARPADGGQHWTSERNRLQVCLVLLRTSGEILAFVSLLLRQAKHTWERQFSVSGLAVNLGVFLEMQFSFTLHPSSSKHY